VPTIIVKSTKCVAWTKTQPVKSGKIHVYYPCIICSSIEHRSKECRKKFEVQNMFRTKFVSSNAMTSPKLPQN